MRSHNKSPRQLQLTSSDYGGLVFGVIFITLGLTPWLFPALEICSQAPDACTYGAPIFILVGLLSGLIGTSRFNTVLDLDRNQYRTTQWRPYRTSRHEGVLSDITGTIEMMAGGSKKMKSRLCVLDVNADYHPVALPGTPASRRMRKASGKIRALLDLNEARSLSAWDLRPSLSEQGSSLRGVAVQEKEVEELQAALADNPQDISAYRQLALRLIRLRRGDEAGVILRKAHRHFLDQDKGNDANHIAAIIATLKV